MQLATGGAWIDPAGRGRRPLRLQCEGWADGLFAVAGFGRGGAGDQAGHVVDADVSGEHDGWSGSNGEAGRGGRHVVDAWTAGWDADAARGHGEQGASEAVGVCGSLVRRRSSRGPLRSGYSQVRLLDPRDGGLLGCSLAGRAPDC